MSDERPALPHSSRRWWARTRRSPRAAAAARNPVHAYLFRGAEGFGGMAAAHGFAAALLCPEGGCGVCATCRGALAGTDPDLHIVRRTVASVSARRRCARSSRWPSAAPWPRARQVIVVPDMHLVLERAPVLLKTLEEPPGQTVFILLADELTPDLTTIASRCAEMVFPPLPPRRGRRCLEASGVPPEMAAVVADSSGGNLERARVMVDDPEVADRVALVGVGARRVGGRRVRRWRRSRGRVIDSADRAVEPLRAAHGRRDREPHRGRQGDGRARAAGTQGDRGAAPARGAPLPYRRAACRPRGAGPHLPQPGRPVPPPGDRSPSATATSGAASDAVGLITKVTQALPRNPNESLLLQSLFSRLAALAAECRRPAASRTKDGVTA